MRKPKKLPREKKRNLEKQKTAPINFHNSFLFIFLLILSYNSGIRMLPCMYVCLYHRKGVSLRRFFWESAQSTVGRYVHQSWSTHTRLPLPLTSFKISGSVQKTEKAKLILRPNRPLKSKSWSDKIFEEHLEPSYGI